VQHGLSLSDLGSPGRPSSSVTSVWTTIVLRPTCRGWVLAWAAPLRTPRKKLVLDSSVVVDAPAGRLTTVAAAPTVSASAIRVPPCNAPPTVRSSSRMVSSATTRSGVASTMRSPSTETGSVTRFFRRRAASCTSLTAA